MPPRLDPSTKAKRVARQVANDGVGQGYGKLYVNSGGPWKPELKSRMETAEMAELTSCWQRGRGSDKRLAERMEDTVVSLERMEATRDNIAAVRQAIRSFDPGRPSPPTHPPPDSRWLQAAAAARALEQQQWMHEYANAARYDHADHGPWVASPMRSTSSVALVSSPSKRWGGESPL